MKFIVFGLSVSSSWGNGHATLWRALCAALGRRGHEVVFFERDVPFYAMHRDLLELPGGRLALYQSWEDISRIAERELENADVGIVTSYCPDAIDATEIILGSSAAAKVFYDLDTPVTLDQLSRGLRVGYIGKRGLQDFDLVLSFTGGTALTELQSRLGAKRAVPLYGCVDPSIHCPAEKQVDFRADLSYLGTYAEDRQQALEDLFITPARLMPQSRFLIGGAQYPQSFPWTENIFFHQHVAPADHPAFYCSSRITLNVTRQAMARMGYCPSGRLFEAAACGVPILSDYWDGLEHFFTPTDEIIVGRSPEDTIAALELSDAELSQIADAARERVLSQHTADRRAEEMEQAVELCMHTLSLANTRAFAVADPHAQSIRPSGA